MPPDPDGNSILFLILTIVFLFLSAVFAAGDSAMTNINESKVRKDSDSENKNAKKLMKIINQSAIISPLLSGLIFCALLGLIFLNGAYFNALYKLVDFPIPNSLRNISVFLIITSVYFLVFLVFAYLFPKKLARYTAENYAYKNASIILFLYTLSKPFLLFCNVISNLMLRIFKIDPKALDDNVTEEEILMMVGEGEEIGIIEENEKDMIVNILDFNDTTVSEIMTHRTEIVAISETDDISAGVTAAVENGYSRLPIYKDDIDSIVGICYIKDLLPYIGKEIPNSINLTNLMRSVYFIPESKKCSQLFKEMTEKKVQIAIVLDEYGGTAGLISLEDLIESIVGNIQDEYDNEEEEIQRVSETEFTVDGATPIDEISDLTGVEFPEGDYDTIAGYVTEQLGLIPKEDEHPVLTIDGYTITVLESADQRIAKLHIVKSISEETQGET